MHKGLAYRYEDHFPVIKRVGKAAYKVQLPPRLKLYPLFHVSLLKAYHEGKEYLSRSES